MLNYGHHKYERTGQPLREDLLRDRVAWLTGHARAMKNPRRKEREGK